MRQDLKYLYNVANQFTSQLKAKDLIAQGLPVEGASFARAFTADIERDLQKWSPERLGKLAALGRGWWSDSGAEVVGKEEDFPAPPISVTRSMMSTSVSVSPMVAVATPCCGGLRRTPLLPRCWTLPGLACASRLAIPVPNVTRGCSVIPTFTGQISWEVCRAEVEFLSIWEWWIVGEGMVPSHW